MKSVGEMLRRERIDRGIDLAKFSALTRINRRYLEAIESGKVDELPSGFFYRSFVRQYATALGLDPAMVEAELERIREAEAPVLEAALQQAEFPIKRPDPIVTESNRRYLGSGRLWVSVALLGVVLVGCSAFYEWWRRMESAAAARKTDVARTATPSLPESQAPGVSVPAQVVKPIPQTADRASAPVETASSVAPPAQGAAAPSAPKTPAIAPDDRVVVQLSATEVTWVSVSADGKSVFSGLLQPKQSVTLGGKERAQLRIGNAAGVEVSWNGRAIGTVGSKGQVRTLLLTPESYRIIAPEGSL
jgi:cytoskeletal protein RodZ